MGVHMCTRAHRDPHVYIYTDYSCNESYTKIFKQQQVGKTLAEKCAEYTHAWTGVNEWTPKGLHMNMCACKYPCAHMHTCVHAVMHMLCQSLSSTIKELERVSLSCFPQTPR